MLSELQFSLGPPLSGLQADFVEVWYFIMLQPLAGNVGKWRAAPHPERLAQ